MDIYIGDASNKGRGIFAGEDIPINTIIEVAPVIVMSHDDRQLLDKTLLHDYIFEWRPGGANMCCMALGWIPIYNHSHEANCEYFMNYDEQTMHIKSMRAIKVGEELTINYNGDWNNRQPVWFSVAK